MQRSSARPHDAHQLRRRWRRWGVALLLAATPVLGVAPPAQAAVPTITSVSPRTGVPGVAVTVRGSGFSRTLADNTVTFGAARATVTRATSTAITVTVPSPRASSSVRVKTVEGTSNTVDFFVPPSPYSAGDVGFTGRASVTGPAVAVDLPTAGKIGILLFDAQVGQRIAIDHVASTMGYSQVRLLRPDGVEMTSYFYGSSNGFIEPFAAPVAGTYSLVVDPDGTSTGSTSFVVRTVPVDSTGTLTRGLAQTVITSAFGQNAVRSFAATAGQRVTVEYSATTYLSAYLHLLHPDGTPIDPGTWASAGASPSGVLVTVTLPVTGTYRVTIDPQLDATGQVTLLVKDAPPSSTLVKDGPSQTLSLASGQTASLTFSSPGDEQLAIGWSGSTIPQAVVRVTGPNGYLYSMTATNNPSYGGDWLPRLPAGQATYTVLVDPAGTYSGSITLRLRTAKFTAA